MISQIISQSLTVQVADLLAEQVAKGSCCLPEDSQLVFADTSDESDDSGLENVL